MPIPNDRFFNDLTISSQAACFDFFSPGGVVVSTFRDAVGDLDMFDDEWRYGTREPPRDAGPEDDEPIVIDLDEAA